MCVHVCRMSCVVISCVNVCTVYYMCACMHVICACMCMCVCTYKDLDREMHRLLSSESLSKDGEKLTTEVAGVLCSGYVYDMLYIIS